MTEKLKVLDLFSGLGGFSLGLERTGHFETVAFCDNDKFSKLILDKHWKGKKVYEDVREITKEKLIADGIELPDVVTGGFPCQPFSVAGKQKGTSDDRHLWPEMFRIIKTLQPRIVVGENVRGIVNIQDGMVFETVCTNLEDEGYEVQAFNIPAAGVGAPHRRERIWFIATLVDTIGNDERREISRSDEEERRIQEEYRTEHSTTRKSSRTSEIRNGDNGYESMANSNNNGFERGFSEARNETITGEKSSSNGSEDTDNFSRRSDGRGDQIQPRTDGTVQGLRDDDKKESSRATGVRGLHEGTDIGQGTIREDRDNKDDNRTLVQTRQSRVQSSEHRGLGEDQTSLEDNQIRQRDDSSSLDRMETRSEINVADTNDEGVRTRIGRSDNDYETESRSRGTDGGRSTSDDERHNIASTEIKEVDVANTESFGSRETRYFDQEERSEGSRATQLDGSRRDVADTNGERSQRTKQSETYRGETETQLSTTQSIKTEGNHWEFEPDVGRVAYGIPGRVHRLKALGNSIVPKIVEEIGYALIKGMK